MFFPPDVSLRVSGEISAAQRLFPAAKQLLFRALQMEKTGGGVPVKLFQTGTDGSLIYVFLHRGLKHLYVQPGPLKVETPETVITEEEIAALECPDMLSGLVVPGTGVAIEDGFSLHQFHPTQIATNTYSLAFTFQDVDRLGVEADPAVTYVAGMQARFPKPSMYSGEMKRVVQAIYGIGKTEYSGIGQLVHTNTDAFDLPPHFTAQNHYDYHWDRTHGIIRVDDEPWVVEISKQRGVLAMPLPRFDCTKARIFRDALVDVGDTETLSVVDAFGGLPSGEQFPFDASEATSYLEDAIAAGEVIRVASADEVAPFYRNETMLVDREPFFQSSGWAFSATTNEAVNTCHWYSAATGEAFRTCELWRIRIHINGTSSGGVTTYAGAMELELIESGLFFGSYGTGFDNPVLYVPQDDTSQNLVRMGMFANPDIANEHGVDSVELVAPIAAFYVNDLMEVVRFRPGSGQRNVHTTLTGYKDTSMIVDYIAHVDPTYEPPSTGYPEEPNPFADCPEIVDWVTWSYFTYDWIGNPGTPFYMGGCLDGLPAWQHTFTYSYYSATSNGWVAIDEFAVAGWAYGEMRPSTGFEGYPVMRRYDFAGSGEQPVSEGFSLWLSDNWIYTYYVTDRPRAFYGTSMNFYPDWEIRIEPSTGVFDAPGGTVGREVRLSTDFLNTDYVDVGLAIPGGVREGYVLLRALRRYVHVPVQLGQTFLDSGLWPNGHDPESDVYDHVEAKGFFVGIGEVSLDNLGGLQLPEDVYYYYDYSSSGVTKSSTRFRYTSWWGQEWLTADLAYPIFHASIAAGASGNFVMNDTVYTFVTRFDTQSIFVENVACGMSASEPRNTTFVGAP